MATQNQTPPNLDLLPHDHDILPEAQAPHEVGWGLGRVVLGLLLLGRRLSGPHEATPTEPIGTGVDGGLGGATGSGSAGQWEMSRVQLLLAKVSKRLSSVTPVWKLIRDIKAMHVGRNRKWKVINEL